MAIALGAGGRTAEAIQHCELRMASFSGTKREQGSPLRCRHGRALHSMPSCTRAQSLTIYPQFPRKAAASEGFLHLAGASCVLSVRDGHGNRRCNFRDLGPQDRQVPKVDLPGCIALLRRLLFQKCCTLFFYWTMGALIKFTTICAVVQKLQKGHYSDCRTS